MTCPTTCKIDGNLPYWNINGSLGDSAAAQNTPNAQWWLYNWYSSMSGNTVKVDGAAANAAYTLQGLASLDTAKKQARVILAGGGTSGDSNTVIKNIDPAVFGSTVHVSVFQDRYSGYIGAAATPARRCHCGRCGCCAAACGGARHGRVRNWLLPPVVPSAPGRWSQPRGRLEREVSLFRKGSGPPGCRLRAVGWTHEPTTFPARFLGRSA